MAAWSWTQSTLLVRPAEMIMAAESDSNDGHRDKLDQTELGIPAARTPGAVSLLLVHKGLFGSHSAVYDIPQQGFVIAAELTVDGHAVVVRRWSLTKGLFS